VIDRPPTNASLFFERKVKDVKPLPENIEASAKMKGRIHQPGPCHLRMVVSVGFLHLAFST